MATSLLDLPNEVLFQIILCLPPQSIPTVQQVCKRFNNLSQPLLWRHYCQHYFTFWSPERHIEEKFNGNVNQTDWRSLFLQRHNLHRSVLKQFNSLLASQIGRIAKAEKILSHGYDIKDTLLPSLRASDEEEDVLARRYYSNSILGSLHRSLAIKEWARLLKGEDVPLERALGSFDMFVHHEDDGDFNSISRSLDNMAHGILESHGPEFLEATPRHKCLDIAAYLRRSGLVGINTDVNGNYHNMQNNFIGFALRDDEHPSLPLISVAIFCCVAQRLGLDARPCGFPFHVLAIIIPPSGQTMDGRWQSETPAAVPQMYMDPFRCDSEVEVEDLKSQLVSLGIDQSDFNQHLASTVTIEIVRRCAKNIITSVQASSRLGANHQPPASDEFPDVDGAFYAALWALILLTDRGPEQADSQRFSFLPYIIQKAETMRYDFSLIEEYILPLIRQADRVTEILEAIRAIRRADGLPKAPKTRTPHVIKCVSYKVGDHFRHRRYNYHAVITGWDTECMAGDAWISRMRVNDLSRGKFQSFYHVQ